MTLKSYIIVILILNHILVMKYFMSLVYPILLILVKYVNNNHLIILIDLIVQNNNHLKVVKNDHDDIILNSIFKSTSCFKFYRTVCFCRSFVKPFYSISFLFLDLCPTKGPIKSQLPVSLYLCICQFGILLQNGSLVFSDCLLDNLDSSKLTALFVRKTHSWSKFGKKGPKVDPK